MQSTMKTTYQGIDIAYDEQGNKWVFELRGRERSCESLAKAKEVIDKPEPREKQPFTRFKAWVKSWGEGLMEVEVTSIAEGKYGPASQVWTSRDDRREKQDAKSVFPRNAENDKLVEQIKALREQIAGLRKQEARLEERMKPYAIPQESASK